MTPEREAEIRELANNEHKHGCYGDHACLCAELDDLLDEIDIVRRERDEWERKFWTLNKTDARIIEGQTKP